MKILTAEIALREETRELQQARSQLATGDFEGRARRLVDTQEELADRAEDVIEQITDLPEGAEKFGKEIGQLTNAGNAMWDAADILAQPNTGPQAIAAETDAIEWLLKAKRSKGGGGGGSSPGDGNRTGDDSNIAALALLGESNEDHSVVSERETRQATGTSGKQLPEEFRRGLDEYFELLERGK